MLEKGICKRKQTCFWMPFLAKNQQNILLKLRVNTHIFRNKRKKALKIKSASLGSFIEKQDKSNRNAEKQ